MNLTPINVYINNNLNDNNNKIKQFNFFLLDVLSSIKFIHWHSNNYNFHKILDNVYNNFNELFDKLSEEIIGMSKTKNICFNIQCPERNLTNLFECNTFEDQINEYYSILDSLESTLKNNDMSLLLNNSINGINNTLEEIFSESNKSKYLINMLKNSNSA